MPDSKAYVETIGIQVDKQDLINMIKGTPVDFNSPIVSATVVVKGEEVPMISRIINATSTIIWNREAFDADLIELFKFYESIRHNYPRKPVELDQNSEGLVVVPRNILAASVSAIDKKRDAPVLLKLLRAYAMSETVVEEITDEVAPANKFSMLPIRAGLRHIVHELNKSPLGPDFKLTSNEATGLVQVIFHDLVVVYSYNFNNLNDKVYQLFKTDDERMQHLERLVCSGIKDTLLTATDARSYETIMAYIDKMTKGRVKVDGL